MKHFLIVLALIAAVSGSTDDWDGLTVKYGPIATLLKNKIYLFNVPKQIDETVASGSWITTDIPLPFGLQGLSFKVSNDYGFNPFYDAQGFIVGVQTCQPYDTIYATGPSGYDPLSRGTVEVIEAGGVKHYCSSALFISPETIVAGGRTSMTSLGDSLWLRDTTNTDTGYVQIPTSITEMLATTEFQWQKCISVMGTHYFWNATLTMDCMTFYNWFLLGDRATDTINGIGFQLWGQNTHYSNDFYDYIPRAVAKYTVPIANDCFYDITGTYGVSSIHIFFSDSPENNSCASGDSVA